MKKLIFSLLLIASFGCKKESDNFSTYKINSVKRPGTFACEFLATSPGKPEIKFYAECEKYKVGDTFKVELKWKRKPVIAESQASHENHESRWNWFSMPFHALCLHGSLTMLLMLCLTYPGTNPWLTNYPTTFLILLEIALFVLRLGFIFYS